MKGRKNEAEKELVFVRVLSWSDKANTGTVCPLNCDQELTSGFALYI